MFENITGTCLKGMMLANIERVLVKDVTVAVAEGALLNTFQVGGKGLEKALAMEAPKAAPAVDGVPYTLR